MGREIYRADARGVVHATSEWYDPAYKANIVPTPALCAQSVDGRLIMCRGPALDHPTCLACIIRGTKREGSE